MKRIVSMLLTLVMVLALCPVFAAAETAYTEAPMLTEMVNAGELPPVEERLPEDPQVLVNPEVAFTAAHGARRLPTEPITTPILT